MKRVKLTYTNYRGETSEREIEPKELWFGKTEWHPEEQWFIKALDCEKGEMRDFALRDFGNPTAIRREARAGALKELLIKWVQRDESLDAAFDAAGDEHSEGDEGNANDIVEAALRALIDQEPSNGEGANG